MSAEGYISNCISKTSKRGEEDVSSNRHFKLEQRSPNTSSDKQTSFLHIRRIFDSDTESNVFESRQIIIPQISATAILKGSSVKEPSAHSILVLRCFFSRNDIYDFASLSKEYIMRDTSAEQFFADNPNTCGHKTISRFTFLSNRNTRVITSQDNLKAI